MNNNQQCICRNYSAMTENGNTMVVDDSLKCLEIEVNYGYEGESATAFFDVNFCPICGRKLK